MRSMFFVLLFFVNVVTTECAITAFLLGDIGWSGDRLPELTLNDAPHPSFKPKRGGISPSGRYLRSRPSHPLTTRGTWRTGGTSEWDRTIAPGGDDRLPSAVPLAHPEPAATYVPPRSGSTHSLSQPTPLTHSYPHDGNGGVWWRVSSCSWVVGDDGKVPPSSPTMCTAGLKGRPSCAITPSPNCSHPPHGERWGWGAGKSVATTHPTAERALHHHPRTAISKRARNSQDLGGAGGCRSPLASEQGVTRSRVPNSVPAGAPSRCLRKRSANLHVPRA